MSNMDLAVDEYQAVFKAVHGRAARIEIDGNRFKIRAGNITLTPDRSQLAEMARELASRTEADQ